MAAIADDKAQTTRPFGHFALRPIDRLVWRIANHRALSAPLRRKLRKRFAARRQGPFDVDIDTAPGPVLRFRTWPTENYCDRVIVSRGVLPERAEHEALLPLISPGCTFIDIGANVGSYSAFVGAACGGNCTLLAMEPHPQTFEKLKINLALNNLSLDNLHNVGVAEEAGTLPLYSDGGSNIGHTSMLAEGTANPARKVDVPVRPLIDLVTQAGIEKIDVLKIDIEGFEDRALYPFLQAAPKTILPSHILIETLHQTLWQHDLAAKLVALGYEIRFETPENRLLSLRA